jgi:predicted metal-dependent hydrolase
VRQQKRRSLAMKLTPGGVQVLIPHDLDPASPELQQFIAEGLSKLATPAPVPERERLSKQQILDLVAQWAQRLDVTVMRVQLRSMRTKWGSISTAGTLTLADDILAWPADLIEYIVVHELLHLKFPDHRQGWQASMGMVLPDWRERERRLQAYVIPWNNENASFPSTQVPLP